MKSLQSNIIYLVCFISLLISAVSWAQGPDTEWYFNPATEIPWASCHIYFDGGAQQKLPFMPLINFKGGPCGTDGYKRNIDFGESIVFVGNGIVKENEYDCYNGLDVTGKAVMMCYDFPDSVNAALETAVSKEERITEAIRRNAGAVILFSYDNPAPFYLYRDSNIEKAPAIPVITINRKGASNIFLSNGLKPDAVFGRWQREGTFRSETYISKISIKMQAVFDRIETGNFSFMYRKSHIPEDDMEKLAAVNERSMDFIVELFKADNLAWSKSPVVYYRDYDTKIFFLHHWGRGLSADIGTFMVYDGKVPDFPLAVHENTHTLIRMNWGYSSSFMNEGLGKYAEAKASVLDANHKDVAGFLKNGELVHINDMLNMKIGSHEKTGIAYPASGSFVNYLISEYSLKKFRQAFELERQRLEEKEVEDTWVSAFGKPLDELEKDWLLQLSKRYGVDKDKVMSFLER